MVLTLQTTANILIVMASSSSSSSLKPSQKRRAITDLERQSIRKRQQEHPAAHQSELIEWFKKATGHELNQSSISKILSSKYECLDSLDIKKDKDKLESKRTSTGDWLDLEGALFEW
jgi:hypothetical protein